MKRCDAGRLGLCIDLAALSIEEASIKLIELADKAMYSCEEEVAVPNALIIRMKNGSKNIDKAIDELLLKASIIKCEANTRKFRLN